MTENKEKKAKEEVILYKILILGDSSVGKTSLLLQFCDEKFDPETLTTVGIDYKKKFIMRHGQKIQLQLCDTAGQERFRSIAKNFYKNCDGIILVYDIANIKSFENIKSWINSIKDNVDLDKIGLIIVGNKIDLEEKREVNLDTVKDFGEKHNIDVFEVSAKNGKGVEEIFTHLTKKLFQKKHIGVVQPGEDEFTMRRGSYVLNAESAKPKNNRNGEGCNC